ncbi:MAG: PorV/PorQ family protein [Candidatus Krumholzibacteriota bacterium]|nr:PorV/PorQ family protein [Candidatus Krumholzibacteriota bacterium]
MLYRKKKTIRSLVPVLAALAVLLDPAGLKAGWADDQNGGMTGDWLASYRTARSLGFGGAFTAIADEPIGMVWNPAGMTRLQMNEVFLETAVLFEGTSINSFSFVIPGRKFPTLGLSVLTLSSGSFERTNEFNESIGTFGESDIAFILSASHDLFSFLSVGSNIKIIRQSIEDYRDTGFGLDLGLLCRVSPKVTAGASLLNIGGPSITLRDTDESYPVGFRGGLAVQTYSGRALVTAEIVRLGAEETRFQTGVEYWLTEKMAMRFGLNAFSPAGGFSFRMPHDLKVDYGMENHELGVTHRFSIGYRFGGFYARSKAVPEVFSPLGSRSVTKFDLSSRTRNEVAGWVLTISDRNEAIVRTFGGKGSIPSHLMWDGKSNTGDPLPDGAYRYLLKVTDTDGTEVTGRTGIVEIDTSIPDLNVPVVVGKK